MDCRGIAGALLAALLVGCAAPKEPLVVNNPDPAVKIPAIAMAVQNKDFGSAKQLVADLDCDDAAVRFYAIQGLQRLTGQTFDYNYYDDASERKPALDRWQAWLASQDKAK